MSFAFARVKAVDCAQPWVHTPMTKSRTRVTCFTIGVISFVSLRPISRRTQRKTSSPPGIAYHIASIYCLASGAGRNGCRTSNRPPARRNRCRMHPSSRPAAGGPLKLFLLEWGVLLVSEKYPVQTNDAWAGGDPEELLWNFSVSLASATATALTSACDAENQQLRTVPTRAGPCYRVRERQ